MAKSFANEHLRKRIWPHVDEARLWMSNQRVGFTQIPRGISLVNRILDKLSRGKPLSGTYLALWCRLFDNGVVKIESPLAAAFESGFSGPRATSTWKSRMKFLVDLGFIHASEGSSGEFSYVLMLDPYVRVAELQKEGCLKELSAEFNALLERIQKANPNFGEVPVLSRDGSLSS